MHGAFMGIASLMTQLSRVASSGDQDRAAVDAWLYDSSPAGNNKALAMRKTVQAARTLMGEIDKAIA